MKRYFVCYTMKDGEITKEKLKLVEKVISKKGKVYVDLLHNKNISILHQTRVFLEVILATDILVIETKDTYKSPWVRKEIKLATYLKKNIKINNLSEILG